MFLGKSGAGQHFLVFGKVEEHVVLKLCLGGGLEGAGSTEELLGCVALQVAPQDVLVGGSVGAVGAGEWLFPGVCVCVFTEELFPRGGVGTVCAHEWPLPSVL